MHAYLSLSSLSDEFLLNLSEYEYDYVYEYEYESVSSGSRNSVTLLSLTSPFRDLVIPGIHVYTGRFLNRKIRLHHAIGPKAFLIFLLSLLSIDNRVSHIHN